MRDFKKLWFKIGQKEPESKEARLIDVRVKVLKELETKFPCKIFYIDAVHYSVYDNGVIRKLAAYVILGINTEGKKEVLIIQVGEIKVKNTGCLDTTARYKYIII